MLLIVLAAIFAAVSIGLAFWAGIFHSERFSDGTIKSPGLVVSFVVFSIGAAGFLWIFVYASAIGYPAGEKKLKHDGTIYSLVVDPVNTSTSHWGLLIRDERETMYIVVRKGNLKFPEGMSSFPPKFIFKKGRRNTLFVYPVGMPHEEVPEEDQETGGTQTKEMEREVVPGIG